MPIFHAMSFRRTKHGLIEGLKSVFGEVFLSIPYAEQCKHGSEWNTLKELENQTPSFTAYNSAGENYGGVWDSTKERTSASPSVETSKFLFLNVWVPQQYKKYPKALPVIIAIFDNRGSCCKSVEIDNALITAFMLQSVIVTFTYRRELIVNIGNRPESFKMKHKVMNERLVMKWAFENISRFDGNSCNITLLSANSETRNLFAHLHEPKSRVLFEKVVMIEDVPPENLEVAAAEAKTTEYSRTLLQGREGMDGYRLLEKTIFLLSTWNCETDFDSCLVRKLQKLATSDLTYQMFGRYPDIFIQFLGKPKQKCNLQVGKPSITEIPETNSLLSMIFGDKDLHFTINTIPREIDLIKNFVHDGVPHHNDQKVRRLEPTPSVILSVFAIS